MTLPHRDIETFLFELDQVTDVRSLLLPRMRRTRNQEALTFLGWHQSKHVATRERSCVVLWREWMNLGRRKANCPTLIVSRSNQVESALPSSRWRRELWLGNTGMHSITMSLSIKGSSYHGGPTRSWWSWETAIAQWHCHYHRYHHSTTHYPGVCGAVETELLCHRSDQLKQGWM